jgi:endonuclease/exonuclease/phosphatase family metal-dependent hydrolase
MRPYLLSCRATTLLLLVAASHCYAGDASALPEIPAETLRVVSFNIRYLNSHDGVNHWKHRRNMMAAFFPFHHVDVAGLQEVLRSQIGDLEERLREFGWVGVGRNNGKDEGEFTPIIYRKSRIEILNSGHFWLSENPEDVGSVGWDAAMTRMVTWARFKEKSSGRTFTLFNTHFDHMGKAARIESAKLLRSKCKELSADVPFLITGDFNCREESEPYRAMLADGPEEDVGTVKDARYASKTPHYGPLSTWNGFQAIDAGKKIDFIFVGKGISTWRHGVLVDRFDDRFLSDHFPVVADVTIE